MRKPSPLTVGSFPYAPGFNPYQRLFTDALESAGLNVCRIPPKKWWPLSHACRQDVDVLHLDWHYDWYRGKNAFTRLLKRPMYLRGLAAMRTLPVVWTAHNLAAHDVGQSGRRAESDDHAMTQRLIDHCSGIMIMSDASETLLHERYRIGNQTRVIKTHHGHYIDVYPNEITRQQARHRLGIPPDKLVFLSLGSIRPYKGLDRLIDSFSKVSNRDETLVVAGKPFHQAFGDQLREQVGQQPKAIADRIRLNISEVPEEDLQVYFNAADICVLPFSDVLNSGSVLLAYSFGKPIVAPSIGSIPEVAIPPYHVGYSPTEPDGLENALIAARSHFRGDQGMHEHSHETTTKAIIRETRSRYSWEASGSILAQFYRELLRDS